MLKHYKDVKQNRKNKIAVVVCSYAGPGSYHYQRDNKCADKLFEDTKFMIKCHEKLRESTLPYDLVVVDNGSTHEGFKKWISKWADKSKHNILMFRENDGFSFGAYKHFWERNKDYDYYLFHEQDIVPCKENWLEELLLKFHSEPGIGVVGNNIENNNGKRFLINTRDTVMNFDGAYYFTSGRILKKCGMQVHSGPGTSVGVINEINFSQPFLDNGYQLCSLAHSESTHSWLSNGSAVCIQDDISGTILPMITLHAIKRQPKIKEYFNSIGI